MENANKPSFEYLTEEINKYFDWNRVYKVMKALDWYWALGKDECNKDNIGIPSNGKGIAEGGDWMHFCSAFAES